MIEVIENNLGRKKITCEHCGSVLKYEKEDIHIKNEQYEVYHKIYETKETNYIVCPVCHKDIIL